MTTQTKAEFIAAWTSHTNELHNLVWSLPEGSSSMDKLAKAIDNLNDVVAECANYTFKDETK